MLKQRKLKLKDKGIPLVIAPTLRCWGFSKPSTIFFWWCKFLWI